MDVSVDHLLHKSGPFDSQISTRVIHSYVVNDKTDFLLLFQPDSESFGK